jgi:hypothetical protein
MTPLRTFKRTQRQVKHLTAREQRLLAVYDLALARNEWREFETRGASTMKHDTTMNAAIRGTPPPPAAQPDALTDVAAINAEIRRLAGRPVEEKHEEHAT